MKRRRVKRKLHFGDESVPTGAGPAAAFMIFDYFTGTVWRQLLAALDTHGGDNLSKKYSE